MDNPSIINESGQMAKKIYLIAIAVIAVLAVASAGSLLYFQGAPNSSPSPSPSATPTNSATGSPLPSSSPLVLPVTVTDDEGNNLTITSYPQRIVTLAPSNTQILFAIGAGDKVVGVTQYDTTPYNFSAWFEAGNMTCIGGFSTPNKEIIVSLQPDLILATPINDVDIATLRSLGYKVLVLNPSSVNGVLNDITMIGKATGQDSTANTLVVSLTSQLDTISGKIAAANVTSKPKVYYEVYAGAQLMTIGSTCWISDVIAQAGGVNIFANETEQWPYVSAETVVQKNPDVILVSASMGSDSYNVTTVTSRDGWGSTNAVQNNRVVIMDGDLFQEAGPRIADQVAAAAKALYPDLFN
jgi:iron complex transport system substrate-binding protein